MSKETDGEIINKIYNQWMIVIDQLLILINFYPPVADIQIFLKWSGVRSCLMGNKMSCRNNRFSKIKCFSILLVMHKKIQAKINSPIDF